MSYCPFILCLFVEGLLKDFKLRPDLDVLLSLLSRKKGKQNCDIKHNCKDDPYLFPVHIQKNLLHY